MLLSSYKQTNETTNHNSFENRLISFQPGCMAPTRPSLIRETQLGGARRGVTISTNSRNTAWGGGSRTGSQAEMIAILFCVHFVICFKLFNRLKYFQGWEDESIYYINLMTKAFTTSLTSDWWRKHLLHKSEYKSIYYIIDIPLGTKASTL